VRKTKVNQNHFPFQLTIALLNIGKSPKSKKSKLNKSASKVKKAAHEVDEVEDNDILMIKVGKNGNEFVKPGYKKYKNNLVSYTDKVLQKLDQIQNPSKARPKTSKKKGKKVEVDLEGLNLNGLGKWTSKTLTNQHRNY